MYKSKNGNTITKTEAVESLKKTVDPNKYPTKFTSEPATRPAYVPQNYTLPNGSNTTVIYNSSYGGYGYMNPITNTFMTLALIDMMKDDRSSNYIMNQEGYSQQPVVVERSRISFGDLLFGFMIIGMIIVIFVVAMKQFRER